MERFRATGSFGPAPDQGADSWLQHSKWLSSAKEFLQRCSCCFGNFIGVFPRSFFGNPLHLRLCVITFHCCITWRFLHLIFLHCFAFPCFPRFGLHIFQPFLWPQLNQHHFCLVGLPHGVINRLRFGNSASVRETAKNINNNNNNNNNVTQHCGDKFVKDVKMIHRIKSLEHISSFHWDSQVKLPGKYFVETWVPVTQADSKSLHKGRKRWNPIVVNASRMFEQ